jgi:hypothetical protein
MEDENTIKVPLPEGTRPNPDTVVTQEIPVVAETLPMPSVERETFVVKTPPTHLLGDPILTMDAPKADDTPLYDQINGPRPKRLRARPRRRMKTGDRVLLGMGVMAAAGVTFVYGLVVYGWGSGPVPEEAGPTPHRTVQVSTSAEEPSRPPTVRHTPHPRRTKAVVVVVAPTSFRPAPTRVRVGVSSPTPSPTPTRATEAPSAPQTSSKAPEPTKTTESPTEAPSASPTPSRSHTSPRPSLPLEP